MEGEVLRLLNLSMEEAAALEVLQTIGVRVETIGLEMGCPWSERMADLGYVDIYSEPVPGNQWLASWTLTVSDRGLAALRALQIVRTTDSKDSHDSA